MNDADRKRLETAEFYLKKARVTLVEQQAAIFALMKFISIRLTKEGEDPSATLRELDELVKKTHQEFLIRIENKDPGTAADLDER